MELQMKSIVIWILAVLLLVSVVAQAVHAQTNGRAPKLENQNAGSKQQRIADPSRGELSVAEAIDPIALDRDLEIVRSFRTAVMRKMLDEAAYKQYTQNDDEHAIAYFVSTVGAELNKPFIPQLVKNGYDDQLDDTARNALEKTAELVKSLLPPGDATTFSTDPPQTSSLKTLRAPMGLPDLLQPWGSTRTLCLRRRI
jgi:hypothetical protein